MTKLNNPRHELFAAYIAEGLKTTESYIKAGFSEKGAQQSAHKLLRHPKIVARIRAIKGEVDEKVSLQVEQSIENAVLAKKGRIALLVADLKATNEIIAERAVFDDHQDVPGGKTGHVITSRQQIGSRRVIGERGAVTVEPEYLKTHSYDTKLVERRMALMEQIRDEMGQKLDRKQQVPMTVDELKQLPVFEAFLESAFKDAEKAGLLDEPSPEDKEAVEDLLNGKV